jgi:hypothetical protein
MFKWPDPPQGRVLIVAPFAIYWGASSAVAWLVGAVMWVIAASEEDKKRGLWKTMLAMGKKKEPHPAA